MPLLTRISLACVALLCAVPFLQPYHQFPLTSFHSEWLAFALGFGVMVILLERRTWEHVEVPWVVLSPLALAVLLMLHAALGWSPYFGQGLTGALYLIWAVALIVAARALTRACSAHTVLAVIAGGLAAGALLSALAGIVQHFNLATPFNALIVRPDSAAIIGNLAQANHFAAYTAIGLLSLVYLYSRGRLPLAVGVAGALPMLLMLGLSGSRSAWLYLVAAFVLACWMRLASPRAAEGRRLYAACGALIMIHYVLQLLVGAGWFIPADREAVTAMERLFSGAESIADRFRLWHAAWLMLLDHPFFGTGWGTYAWRYFESATVEYAAGTDAIADFRLYHNAHNLPLHLLAETGVIGTALVVIPLLVWLRQVLRSAWDAHQWWLLAALAVLSLHSLLEFPLWYAYFLAPVALLLGTAPARAFVPQHVRMGRMLAVAAVFGGAFNLVTLSLDYRDFERVFQPSPGNVPAAEMTELMLRLQRNPLLTPYIEVAIALPLAVDEKDLDGRLSFTGKALQFVPLPTLVYRQVLLLALAGRLAEAQVLLARSRRAYPVAPPEFTTELARLAGEYPERFRPLLESRVHRAPVRH